MPLDDYEKIGNDLNNGNKNDEVQRNTKVKVKNSLSNVGADLYKSNFLKEFQPKVLSEIFKLIREEGNAKKDFLKIKIKKLMEIVQDMEIKNPIIKKKNKIINILKNI